MQKTTNITKEDELAQTQSLPGPWWFPSPHHADEYKYIHHLDPNSCFSHLGAAGQDQQKSAGDKTNPDAEKDSQNHQENTTTSSQLNDHFQIRLGQSMAMTKSTQADQFYGLFPSYGPQPAGIPMSLASDGGTVYVNPKQYHRILCRRKIRAKAALQLQARQAKDKSYVHESRHLHAMRRPRGAGGRFLTSKEIENLNYTQSSPRQFSNPSQSSSSEVLQGEIGEGKSSPYGSEVTSVMYSRQLDWYHQHQLASSVGVEDGHGCCNFLKA